MVEHKEILIIFVSLKKTYYEKTKKISHLVER